MCLGIPMKIVEFSSSTKHIAHCEQGGIQRDVNTFLLNDLSLSVGDYVLVHVGYAIQVINHEEAVEREALFNEMNKGETSNA